MIIAELRSGAGTMHMTVGARAMCRAINYSEPEKLKRKGSGSSKNEDLSAGYISMARTVLKWALCEMGQQKLLHVPDHAANIRRCNFVPVGVHGVIANLWHRVEQRFLRGLNQPLSL